MTPEEQGTPAVPPQQTPPPRIGRLAALPLFFNLDGRNVLLAGDGSAAVWKAELLAAAGAQVTVCALEHCEEMRLLAQSFPGQITLLERPWRPEDLRGAALAVGALADAEAGTFAAAAREAGLPVNIIDKPRLSTFSFGTLVNRFPVTIAIGTGGAAPVLAQAIRARIEALLHPALGSWAQAARRLREAVAARFAFGAARRDAWGRFAAAALAARRAPEPGEAEQLALEGGMPGTGRITLVGAGPGDPELLTLKALRTLQSADVILYDRLVAPEVLELARREAVRIAVGKTGRGPRCRQDDINALLVRYAREGKHAVRLKGGDPLIFGRASEEIGAARAAGIPVEVVPGISAVFGAAAELALPLTDRKQARRLQIVTGHAENGKAPAHDWPSLADPWATTAFYMGAATFSEMLPELLKAGLDPALPAAIISSVATPRRSAVHCAVHELPRHLAGLPPGEPRLILMGRVLGGVQI